MAPTLFSLALLPLLGCVGELDVPLDQDGDGLLSNVEESMGLDPNNADSDGDNHQDKVEVDQGFDPLNPEDHPYAGGYAINRCESAPSEGTWSLQDQYDEEVKLEDFCNSTILLQWGGFW